MAAGSLRGRGLGWLVWLLLPGRGHGLGWLATAWPWNHAMYSF